MHLLTFYFILNYDVDIFFREKTNSDISEVSVNLVDDDGEQGDGGDVDGGHLHGRGTHQVILHPSITGSDDARSQTIQE